MRQQPDRRCFNNIVRPDGECRPVDNYYDVDVLSHFVYDVLDTRVIGIYGYYCLDRHWEYFERFIS